MCLHVVVVLTCFGCCFIVMVSWLALLIGFRIEKLRNLGAEDDS